MRPAEAHTDTSLTASLRTQGNCRTLATASPHIACSEEITITKALAERLHATGVADELTDLTERQVLAGIATVLLQDNEVVDEAFYGFADIDNKTPVRGDTIHRIFSNTKIITSIAMLMLYEEGQYQLDDPLVQYLPALDHLKVLKAGATDVTDTEALATPPTIRQAFTHTTGFSYGTFQESPVDRLFMEAGVQDRTGTLADMIDKLAEIPLARQPGTRWQYSIATDILARLVEVMSGETFADFLSTRLFQPLGMTDTGFHITEDQVDRLATLYAPVNMMDESKGLQPLSGMFSFDPTVPPSFCSGGGGLLSTISDYTRFVQLLIGRGEYQGQKLLQPETLDLMTENHLPEGLTVHLPGGMMQDHTFGLGVALKSSPSPGEPDGAVGEFHWAGIAGTHSWINRHYGIAGLAFTQRMPGFFHAFNQTFKRRAYEAAS
ncbi:MAG: serine hydrolase domain-containing protein [Pseudomonadota bacterium]